MRGWGRWLLVVVLLGAPMQSTALAWEPQWVTDLRAKADAYQKRLEEALARLRRRPPTSWPRMRRRDSPS